jgi:hypothetical protein
MRILSKRVGDDKRIQGLEDSSFRRWPMTKEKKKYTPEFKMEDRDSLSRVEQTRIGLLRR